MLIEFVELKLFLQIMNNLKFSLGTSVVVENIGFFVVVVGGWVVVVVGGGVLVSYNSVVVGNPGTSALLLSFVFVSEEEGGDDGLEGLSTSGFFVRFIPHLNMKNGLRLALCKEWSFFSYTIRHVEICAQKNIPI